MKHDKRRKKKKAEEAAARADDLFAEEARPHSTETPPAAWARRSPAAHAGRRLHAVPRRPPALQAAAAERLPGAQPRRPRPQGLPGSRHKPRPTADCRTQRAQRAEGDWRRPIPASGPECLRCALAVVRGSSNTMSAQASCRACTHARSYLCTSSVWLPPQSPGLHGERAPPRRRTTASTTRRPRTTSLPRRAARAGSGRRRRRRPSSTRPPSTKPSASGARSAVRPRRGGFKGVAAGVARAPCAAASAR